MTGRADSREREPSTTLDTAPLRLAYDEFLKATESVVGADKVVELPPGEWNAEQVLAHVSMVNAATIAAAYSIASGAHANYDNRVALDSWSIQNQIKVAGGGSGLRRRIHAQAKVLCDLDGHALSGLELETEVPTILLSNDALMVKKTLTLGQIIVGLAESEIPGHTRQLLALLPDRLVSQAAASDRANVV